MSPMPLRERNRQRVRQRIIAAAADLFGSDGYAQTTMDDIAQKAEVSRATLFNYFPTKDALLIPFAVEIFQSQIQPRLTAYLSSKPDTFDAFRFLFTDIHHYVFAVRDIDRAFKRAFLEPKALERSDHIYEAGFTDSLIEILRYGQRRGEVRTDLTLEKQAGYIGALYISIFYSMVMNIDVVEHASEVETLLRFLESGLRPPT